MLRQRHGRGIQNNPLEQPDMPQTQMQSQMPSPAQTSRTPWMLYALASGACAAFNGVFAKLTTTTLTSALSASIANLLNLASHKNAVELTIRGMFFALNLTFNGIMWTLFTKALARGSSTTQVSIINTSANFVMTALLGLVVFAEALPPLWWVGAALLVAGNVVVGRKDEDAGAGAGAGAGDGDGDGAADEEVIPLVSGEGEDGYDGPEEEDDVADLGDLSGFGVGGRDD